MPLALGAGAQGDGCSCGNDPEEVTTDFLQVPGNDGIQEQHQIYSRLPHSLSLGLRDVPWTEVYKEQLGK